MHEDQAASSLDQLCVEVKTRRCKALRIYSRAGNLSTLTPLTFTILIMHLIVRSSAIHAAGVFTLEPIPKGTIVVEYTGTRMKHDDADNLYNERPYTYLFGVGDGMYLNHSCAPNCETEEDEDERVWIRAIRDIEPGEELVYDYFLYDGEGDAPCTCGAEKCRGTMYSPKELGKRKRAARKPAGDKPRKPTRAVKN